ncbi:DUF3100 domain-containing protein [Megasphaera hominis]|uniref:DUF3100 domain-containing protein n=1 Tax=Megasphaera hominis TaxID=159836 RepID=A0ABR6VHF1_9FIRM|nr:DUF3100 domain-containing protein [uncultured Megasphaera sp.]MBC3536729.1 DUF3100 domain-containing protein [Megasphaera hominis]
MDLVKNWRIHLFALILVIVAETIGIQKHGLVIFLPMLYALVLGGIISYPSFHILNEKQMTRAGNLMSITMLFLIAKIGLGIGPNLHLLLNSGIALIMQEFGHFFGTLIFGLPTAILLKMGREAIGACYSIDREANVAIIAEKFGIFSPEGRGVMGMYICGTLFGALWISILAGIIARTGLFHPYALAMGGGIGSASMMAASVGSIVAVFPEETEKITAFAGAANLMTSVIGIYFSLFISLPVTIKVYEWVTGRKRHEEVAAGEVQENAVADTIAKEEEEAKEVREKSSLGDDLFILCLTGVLTLIGNFVGFKVNPADDFIGCLMIIAICFAGILIARIPGLKKLPVVFWVSIIAVIVSIPSVPGATTITAATNPVNFLAACTPILAYGGLSLGKDIPAFKRLSWRIVPVALMVASGTFICATLMAEVMLHLEGVI